MRRKLVLLRGKYSEGSARVNYDFYAAFGLPRRFTMVETINVFSIGESIESIEMTLRQPAWVI
jgi:hypothetical protein